MQFVEDVYARHAEIIITKHGKPWTKLMGVDEALPSQPFIGSFIGVGHTGENLLEPFTWESKYVNEQDSV